MGQGVSKVLFMQNIPIALKSFNRETQVHSSSSRGVSNSRYVAVMVVRQLLLAIADTRNSRGRMGMRTCYHHGKLAILPPNMQDWWFDYMAVHGWVWALNKSVWAIHNHEQMAGIDWLRVHISGDWNSACTLATASGT